MTRDLAKQFNEEVERYRRALLYYARKCDWEEFKVRAGRLFEYLENIEALERERRFYQMFYGILGVLALGIVLLLGIDAGVHASWLEYRRSLLLAALAGCSYELFFYINFRRYVQVRMAEFRRRRQAFIRNIENDFRSFDAQPEGSRG